MTSTIVFEKSGVVEEYVGGYDDWLRQRKEITIATKQVKAKKTKESNSTVGLTYQEQQELKSLPVFIEKLEQKQQQLHQQLASSDFYQQEKETILAVQREAGDVDNQLKEAYERWEKLDALSIQ